MNDMSADRPRADAAAVSQAHAPSRRRRRPSSSVLLLGAAPIVLAIAGYAWMNGGQTMSTENAYVQADMLGIATDVSGMVKSIDVAENQQVRAGEVLFRLDDLPFRLALARTEAQLAAARDEIAAQKATYRDMQAQILQAQNDIVYYGREFARQQDLATRQVAAQATLDGARRNLDQAQQKLASLNQQSIALVANLNGNPDIRPEDHPRVRDAAAQRDEAQRQLDHATVRAPMDGIVTNVSTLQPGQYLASATVAFNLVASDHVWVLASPKETELTHVRPGQKATVTVDSYPGVTWHGTVESISPASSASFSLLPAQNTSGNWVKVVQRIPMRVRLDRQPGQPDLRVGMSVVVDVDTGHRRGLPAFVTDLLGLPSTAHASGD